MLKFQGAQKLNLQVAETKYVMGKENWLKHVIQQKQKLESVMNVDNEKNFQIVLHTSVFFLE